MDEKKITNRPFSQLSDEQQKAAIDVAVAVTVLGTRLPTLQQPFTDSIVAEFIRNYGGAPNVIKYAFRELGANLYHQDWMFSVTKAAERLSTQFTPLQTSHGGNGEIIIKP